MAITNGYTTLSDLKARMGITDTTEDALLEAAITAASRAIDDWTGRRFYAATETRYYSADNVYLLSVDDLLSVDTLKIDDGSRTYATTWAATDFELEPANTDPKTRIAVTPQGRYTFPWHKRSVEVTGSFGYSATAPAPIQEACLMLAARYFRRKDAPLGDFGGGGVGEGSIAGIDPDIRAILAPYRRIEVF